MSKKPFHRFFALLSYARPYWRGVSVQLSLMGISIGFGLLKPWPMKVLVDNVIGDQLFHLAGWQPDWSWKGLLLASSLAYLLFHAGESLVHIASGTVATLTSSRMIRDMRSALLDRVQTLAVRFHDNHKVGDLVHRITYNSTAVETAFQSGFMGVVKSGVTLLAMFVVMMFMSPLLTLIALVVVPFLLITIRIYAKRIHRVSFEHQNQEGNVASLLQEILSSIRLIKAYNRESLEHRRFFDLCTNSIGTRLRNTLVQNSFGFFTAVILAAGTALMFWVGVRQVKTGGLTTGEFLVFIAYLSMLYAPLSVLSYTSSSVQGALGGAHRLFEILESTDEIPEAKNPLYLEAFHCTVAFNNVSFRYEPTKPVLCGINLEIRRGEALAIVGETGGGKSTLLNLLLRFYDPDEGSICIDGHDLRTIAKESLRQLISYVPQDVVLLSDTIRENIAFGRPEATDREIIMAAENAQAHSFIMECSHGYETMIGERGIRLSMGQRQRLAIARALVRKTPILLIDEPTSALDAETEARIMRYLRGLKDMTVILVAHRLSTVRSADQIVVLAGGKIAEQGSHDALLEQKGAYYHLWTTQVSGFQKKP
jgi:ATP-binding cassette subfamily B protein/subfamily B ATP-binding cassette protein MsbA